MSNDSVLLLFSSFKYFASLVSFFSFASYQYYKRLNIRVVLVGLEIFKESNPFSVEASAGEVLGSFVKWRKTSLLPRIRHDVGQLIV